MEMAWVVFFILLTITYANTKWEYLESFDVLLQATRTGDETNKNNRSRFLKKDAKDLDPYKNKKIQ
jgi:hypothetical protein